MKKIIYFFIISLIIFYQDLHAEEQVVITETGIEVSRADVRPEESPAAVKKNFNKGSLNDGAKHVQKDVLHSGDGLRSEKYNNWLREFRASAIAEGIRPEVFDDVMRGVSPIAKVKRLDKKQPEFTKTYKEYLASVVPDSRVQKGRALIKKHQVLLDEVSTKYGVPKQLIVALWGIETSYGEVMGKYYLPAALATLAYDGRRKEFFRVELINTLKMVNRGYTTKSKLYGSWAGAMGQSQFMPSSYLAYAVDYDGDGQRDIWNSLPDVFASIANYMKNAGWDHNIKWGEDIEITENSIRKNYKKYAKKQKHLSEWKKLGIKPKERSFLNDYNKGLYLVIPGKERGRSFLVTENFQHIMKWNKSDYFATSVGILSDKLN